MPDLRVVATIPALPGSEDVIRAALTTLASATRAHDGCLGYELFEFAAADGHLAGEVAVHRLRPVVTP